MSKLFSNTLDYLLNVQSIDEMMDKVVRLDRLGETVEYDNLMETVLAAAATTGYGDTTEEIRCSVPEEIAESARRGDVSSFGKPEADSVVLSSGMESKGALVVQMDKSTSTSDLEWRGIIVQKPFNWLEPGEQQLVSEHKRYRSMWTLARKAGRCTRTVAADRESVNGGKSPARLSATYERGLPRFFYGRTAVMEAETLVRG